MSFTDPTLPGRPPVEDPLAILKQAEEFVDLHLVTLCEDAQLLAQNGYLPADATYFSLARLLAPFGPVSTQLTAHLIAAAAINDVANRGH